MRSLCADWREAGVLCALRRLATQAGEELKGWEDWKIDGSIVESVSRSGMTEREVAAQRVAFGEELERYAANACARLCKPGQPIVGYDAKLKCRICQLYFDSYAAACWTSAHAEYLASLEAGIAEPPSPTIGSVPCASSAYDLDELFARRVASRETLSGVAWSLVQILSRCTNPSSRGWQAVLKEALNETATNSIVKHALLVCLTGMHPQLHPSLRPDWRVRMRVLRCCTAALNKETIYSAVDCVKEAMRRCLASTMASSTATHAALSMLGHPVQHLHQPPFNLPHVGMEAAMDAFVTAGCRISSETLSRGSESLHGVLAAAFNSQTPGGFVYKQSWMGKGTANVHARQPLVHMAGDIWSAAFKANFIAFWIFAQTHQMRVSRLDAVQHSAIHSMNTATRLAAQLDDATALRVQRTAFATQASGIMTVGEVAALLGIKGVGQLAPNGGARSVDEAIQILSDLGSRSAAKLLSFARVAWLHEQLQVVNLGAHTKAMQVTALRKRLELENDTPVEDMPMHCTHICACPECQRVANACAVSNRSAPSSFNELGVSSCQIDWGASGVKLHCAKRSSAALRTAVAFEDDMKRRKIETEQIDSQAVSLLTAPRTASTVESGVAARIRRDAKNTMEQRSCATACGEEPMITLPIVGRAIRLYNHWYALCSYCGALTQVTPHLTRYGAEICCLRCDDAMMSRGDGRRSLSVQSMKSEQRRLCRFCGAIDAGTNWKEVKAPLDVAGTNAMLPPPLRKVFYCRQHFRSWVPNAHRVLETRAILSHICHNAKPIFATETLANAQPDDEQSLKGKAKGKKTIKKRRLPKHK